MTDFNKYHNGIKFNNMILIESKQKNYGVHLPENIHEITPDMLHELTKNINLPKYYCIVGLCFKTKLFDLCTLIKQSKDTNLQVTPIIAKIHNADSLELNAEVGDTIIIDRSSLERGAHLNLNTAISSVNVRNYLKDNELVKDILSSDIRSKEVIIMEFKVCPVSDIKAVIANITDKYDPFKEYYKSNS